MRFKIITLGCKVNQYESEAMELLLTQHGHHACGEGELAEVVIVNSCAVTGEGARKVRQTARRLQKQNPGAMLALCGCLSQVEPEVAKDLQAAVCFGTGHRAEFVDALERAFAEKTQVTFSDDPFRRQSFERLPSGAYEGHARAYLKIQDGCDNFCTYCIIPFARGRVLSLPKEECAQEARKLAEAGYREIVITGIEISSWGKDLKNGETLIDALEAIGQALPEGVRMHLGSLEPTIITEDFANRLAKLPVCAHFHPALQAGCDTTLQAMHRKYDTATFLQAISRLRGAFPNAGITTDLICGFPGESEKDFEQTLRTLQQCGFSAMHIFPYSVREGTKAAAMKEQLAKSVKDARCERAQAVAGQMRQAFLQQQVGQVLQVLFETEKNGVSSGHSENYLEVTVKATGLRGQILPVRITELKEGTLAGNLEV